MPDDRVLSTETAHEFFHRALMEALKRERVSVGRFTEYYVFNLLVNQIHDGHHPDETLADRYAQAMHAAQAERARLLRVIGDTALVTCGLWCEHAYRLRHEQDLDYHMAMGRMAYSRLGAMPDQLGAFSPDVFTELADCFGRVVDALIRFGTEHSIATAGDILRLYARWEKTHSRQAAQALAARGIMVTDSHTPTRS